MKQISIRGARMHNLANISLDLPRNKLIVITGLSGSGKSSLAFDTIYAEGQRRYVESLSAYARQFLSLMEKPDVDHIEGLSPAISIEQKSTSHNPRSTVGTVTEIHDYLRLLFARIGEPRCPQHDLPLKAQTVSQMVDQVMSLNEGERLLLLAPVIQERKGEHSQVIEQLRAQGFIRARIDGEVMELESSPELRKNNKHTIEAVVDRLVVKQGIEQRLAESFETALELSDGLVHVLTQPREGKARQLVFSARYACPTCGYSLSELEPRLFSFNNPAGACPGCDGLGVRQLFDPNRIIRDPALSLAAGAIAGWDRRNGFYFNLLTNLSAHYGFSIDTAYEDLPEKIKKVILRGSGKEKITFHYKSMRGQSRTHAFEGVIPNMERRYKETESHAVRDELARFLSVHTCEKCQGSRLREEARHVFIGKMALHDISALPIDETVNYFSKLKLEGSRAEIASRITQEITESLGFLANVGLGYLSLSRSAETLSGGEAQRIRLASQIGSALVGVMYVLDEPSIGLHQRDNSRLLATLEQLRDLGNTVIVVEHDEEAIRSADHVLDLGPGAGVNGGHIVAQGTPEEILNNPASVTGKYLSGELSIAVPAERTAPDNKKQLVIRGASGNNLREVEASIPVGLLTCITGVSGSGKSTLINDTLYPAVAVHLNGSSLEPAPYHSVDGLDHFDKVIDIDQSPIGRTPRSNPATYTGLFTPIRELFANTPEARARGYKPGRFSFNVKGGRCEACQGDGMIKVEMHFLPDIYVPCDSCKGARYNRETLDITYKGKSIQEVLQMSIEVATDFFQAVPVVKRKLDTLMDVGLGYICLGQSATTLSGGEAQRIKLSRELSKRGTGKTLYILDEPTTGLHFQDIELLLTVLHRLRDQGNTVIVIEHNLDVIKTADWIVDLGPEGGAGGGSIIAVGTPEQVSRETESYTGIYLKPLLERAASQTST
jgi:excinuclease ABC subunit A